MPEWVLAHRQSVTPRPRRVAVGRGFSLAGVQMKFSMREQDGRFFGAGDALPGDWIVKPPSPHHPLVGENEYFAIALAPAAGGFIPKVRPVPPDGLPGVPGVALAGEPAA